jgi:hypothetical protein
MLAASMSRCNTYFEVERAACVGRRPLSRQMNDATPYRLGNGRCSIIYV